MIWKLPIEHNGRHVFEIFDCHMDLYINNILQ